MNLRLIREPSAHGATIGVLFVSQVFQCFTLEDEIREQAGVPVEQWKVPGKTAIPSGTYAVALSWSPHFQATLPEVLAVPGFSGIRIHAGNYSTDTEGCILVGQSRGDGSIYESRLALTKLLAVFPPAGTILNIENPS